MIFKDIRETLGSFLLTKMTSLSEVIYEFPDPNHELSMPSLSIINLNPIFTPEMSPYILEKTDPEDHETSVKYVDGNWEIPLQLDLWCQYKIERDTLLTEFMDAVKDQFPILGLTLAMSNYYGRDVRYDFVEPLLTYGLDDDSASQRGEFRVKINLMASCESIKEKTEYAMETFETHDYIGENLIIEE